MKLHYAISDSLPVCFSPNMRLAFARILAADAAESLPFLTCCVARAFALAAWLRSGIGYLRSFGSPNVLADRCLRAEVVMWPIRLTAHLSPHKERHPQFPGQPNFQSTLHRLVPRSWAVCGRESIPIQTNFPLLLIRGDPS